MARPFEFGGSSMYSSKRCATCAFWGGRREFEAFRVLHGGCSGTPSMGKCGSRDSPTWGRMREPRGNCKAWVGVQ